MVDDNGQIDGTDNEDDPSDPFEFTVETQKHEAKRDNAKFPDPELLAMKLNHGTHDGVDLIPFGVQNHHGEERIENIEPYDEDQEDEQGRTIPVYIAPMFLVCLSAKGVPFPQKSVTTQYGGWFLPAIF